MIFFKFSKPNYSTDFVDRKLNPINLIEGVKLPSIICDECSILGLVVIIQGDGSFV